jgi:Ran GTPase-activating protein (RanGAP) involved in mRNA processing and transport
MSSGMRSGVPSKRLQRIHWKGEREEMICCFLHAFQESTSLKELHMEFPFFVGSSNLALENMLTHTQSLRSLSFICRAEEDIDVAAVWSGLKKSTTLRELTLNVSQGATNVSLIITSLRDHPFLRKLCLFGDGVDLTGLVTLLQSHTSKITELDIHRSRGGSPFIGLTSVLQALARRPTLTKLALRRVRLGRDEATLLRMALSSIPSLQSLVLTCNTLRSAGLAKLAPTLYHNTSIKVLDLSWNDLNDMESAEMLRDILRSNKTMTALDLAGNKLGQTTGAVECTTDGLGSNSTLLKIDLSRCDLGDGDFCTLTRSIGSRNTTLQKLTLSENSVTSAGVGVLVETMEQGSHNITDLELNNNPMGNEVASLIARSLGKNALPNLKRLSIFRCCLGDDGFITLMSALEQYTSLLQLHLRYNYAVSERVFLALAEGLNFIVTDRSILLRKLERPLDKSCLAFFVFLSHFQQQRHTSVSCILPKLS